MVDYQLLVTILFLWLPVSGLTLETPPLLADRFSVSFESIDDKGRQITSTRHIVDYSAQFMRTDFSPGRGYMGRHFRRYGDRPLIVINDFNTGHEFVIDRWRGNCSVHNISVHSRAAVRDNNNNIIGMKHPYDLFATRNGTFDRKDSIRGLPVDVFVRHMNRSEVSVYYLQKAWGSVTEEDEHAQDGVPVAVTFSRYNKTTNESFHRTIHMYDYTTDHTEFGAGPMVDCFDQFETVQFQMNGNPGVHFFNGQIVKYTIIKALAQAMNVTFVRVALATYGIPTDRDFVMVTFRLYEPITVPGNIANVPTETPIDQAIQNLRERVNSGMMNLTVPYFGQDHVFTMTPASVVVVSASPPPTGGVTSQTGVIAGVGIALLLVGLMVGFGAAFFLRKRFPCDKQVPYEQTQ